MTSSVKSIDSCIDPSSVAGKAAELVDRPDNTALNEAYRLHRFCLKEIRYERYEELRPAKEVLETGEGDCTDQTILLTSMLLNREIPVVIVDAADHMFPEALLPVEPGEELDERIEKFYNLPRGTDVRAVGGDFSFTGVTASGYWYPVDSVMSRYLGDFQVHAEEDVLVEEDDAWNWNQLEFCKAYEPDSLTAKS
jgi:hypothetical protein